MELKNFTFTKMKKQKLISNILITLFLVVFAGSLLYLGVTRFSYQPAKPVRLQLIQRSAQTPDVSKSKPASNIPAAIQKIMNNNLTGIVTGISASSISVESNGTNKTFNLTKNTFILTSGKLGNGKITDIKQKGKVYIQFDPDTNDALTITIEQ